jgi:DNA-binding MarR family transcriptional regulator
VLPTVSRPLIMLTREMFLALLQGLPAADLSFLDRPWNLLAVRIERNLKKGLQPPDALHAALDDSPDWERQLHLRAFLNEDPVLALPDLSPRQKDALIVLRSLGSCSLAQLSRLLMRDRSNIRRTLEVLVAKSYIIKYFRKDGPAYLAITSPLSDQQRSEAIEILQAYKEFLMEGSTGKEAPSPTTATTTTTTTKATTPTTATTPTSLTTATTPTMAPALAAHFPRPP